MPAPEADGPAAAAAGSLPAPDALLRSLQGWARELGFAQIGVADVDLSEAQPGLTAWLEARFHGDMAWMAAHPGRRSQPATLVPGTLRVVTARMDYLPRDAAADWAGRESRALHERGRAVVSLYARGRDYHRVLRPRLQRLADRLAAAIGPFGHRAFTDSAPVLEVELATRSGLGWRGKHTLALQRDAGSMFFLGELFTSLPLPLTAPVSAHCGRCTACIDVCPTRAIVAPYRLDARRCISYLTIEHQGAIEPALRPLIGNRIYGCDDCQLACPWNQYAQRSPLPDFDERHGLGSASLLALWQWDEATFHQRHEGSAIRRIGWQRWRRNLAVAIGNLLHAADDAVLRAALQAARAEADTLVGEHIDWALATPAG